MAAQPQPTRLFRLLSRRWWVALLVMGLSFVLFGLASLNLIGVLRANLAFLLRHGADAVRDGGLLQLLELAAYGYAAAACYVVFKLCEKALVERIAYGGKD
jgi:hypothetical protein